MPQPALTSHTLAPEILAAPHNQYHQHALRAVREAALWAALTGIELLAIKAGMKHGEWQPWVAANCAFSYRTAARYCEAGQRALDGLATTATQPSLAPEDGFEEGKRKLGELLDNDGLAEERAALIAAIKPPKPPAPPAQIEPPKPAKPRKPPVPVTERPLFSTTKVVPVVVERWRHTPTEVRHAFLDSIAEEALAYLQSRAA